MDQKLPPLPMQSLTDHQLAEKAMEVRRWIVRMCHAAQSGHPGGSLGLADIFTVLYLDILRIRPHASDWEDRDRLILSNAHVSPVRYASMKMAGFFPDIDLLSFRKFGSPLQGHPSTRYLPEVENSGGSLGQGLSVAVGLALGLRIQKKSCRVFVSMSDGECGEGMTWEAITAAVHHKAPVIAFLDHNGIQIDGKTKDVCDLGDLADKFQSFGWGLLRTDGHNISEIRRIFQEAMATMSENEVTVPQMILFDTIPGKGVSYMENDYRWHGKAPNDELTEQALEELQFS